MAVLDMSENLHGTSDGGRDTPYPRELHINEGEGGFHWHYRVPVEKNPLIWRELIVTFALPFAIIAVIALLFSGTGDRMLIIVLLLILYALFLAAAGAIIHSISRSIGGRVDAIFTINSSGITYECEDSPDAVRHGLTLLSLISGIVPQAVTSLVALSQKENFIAWADIKTVRVYRDAHLIYFWSREQSPPIAFFCTPDIFDHVVQAARKHLDANGIHI
jgi:hypothetical protein